jgi:hypothetical protein
VATVDGAPSGQLEFAEATLPASDETGLPLEL